MQNNSKKNSGLFGFGVVAYGFLDLLTRHPKDFSALIGHIFKDYFFEQYKSAHDIRYIDISLDSRIISRPGALNTYMSFMPFLIGSMGFLKWHFGNSARQDICLFMKDIVGLYSDAGFVFENAPTKIKHRESPGLGLKLLHFFDRPRNCFPSLHVVVASYSYLKTKELVNKYSPSELYHQHANNMLRQWALSIIESCLLTKQHGLRDIAGGLALVSAKYPQFSRKDVGEIISLLFSDERGMQEDVIGLARQEIESVYMSLVGTISSDPKMDYRSALVSYVRSI